MGVYYGGGVVYGYKVLVEDLLEKFGDFDTVHDAASHYGVGYAWEGNFNTGGPPEVVFTAPDKHNYVKADSGLNYGFKGVDELDTSTEGLEQVMEELEGDLGFYAFFSVT